MEHLGVFTKIAGWSLAASPVIAGFGWLVGQVGMPSQEVASNASQSGSIAIWLSVISLGTFVTTKFFEYLDKRLNLQSQVSAANVRADMAQRRADELQALMDDSIRDRVLLKKQVEEIARVGDINTAQTVSIARQTDSKIATIPKMNGGASGVIHKVESEMNDTTGVIRHVNLPEPPAR